MTPKEYLNDLNFEPNLDQLDRGDADLGRSYRCCCSLATRSG